MLIGIAYLALFLAAGLLLARWAVPDGSPAVAVPLGGGFGVSRWCAASRCGPSGLRLPGPPCFARY
mgnify:CR=1 FL=1